MALSMGLQLRQSQSLVMTPQLLQAIKLLQFSALEVSAYVEAELERNPLLERVEDEGGTFEAARSDDAGSDDGGDGPAAGDAPIEGDWASPDLETSRESMEARLGSDLGNCFDEDRSLGPAPAGNEGLTLTTPTWTATGGGSETHEEDRGLDGFAAAKPTLREALLDQLSVASRDPGTLLIGRLLIDAVDEAGYLSEPLDTLAARVGAPLAQVEACLCLIQTFEPSGVAARSLSECLAIQLCDLHRFDPAMEALLSRLDLLAKRDFPALQHLCGVDEEDLADMVREIRRLEPKPGSAYGMEPAPPVVPDVLLRAAASGGWIVELNAEALPRVLVNQAYYSRIQKSIKGEGEKSFIQNCHQTANWLARSLDQRAKTILKVAGEIVRQQDSFFLHGVAHLRPLNLRTVADAIGMHESTVSRVTSNKYMATPRGLFELKYFFTTSIAASGGGEAHSAEAVRHRIRGMIDAEGAGVLSDDAIVERLRTAGVDIARRTVAKYRESLRIPSSVERKREKTAMPARRAG